MLKGPRNSSPLLGTLVSCEPVETIVALGPLIRLGCRMQWVDKECVLWHPRQGRIRIDVSSGCPRVSEDMALSLIEEIERHRVGAVEAALKAMKLKDDMELPRPEDAVASLTEAISWECNVAEKLGEAVIALWPEVPEDLLQEMSNWAEADNSVLMINRLRERKGFCFICSQVNQERPSRDLGPPRAMRWFQLGKKRTSRPLRRLAT